MDTFALKAISPVDGRYSRHTQPLSAYFSEEALFRYRVRVEVEYLLALSQTGLPQIRSFAENEAQALRNLYLNFGQEDARAIKKIEGVTNHDVKAVEYFIKEKLEGIGRTDVLEFVHFGLTSQDINNTSVPLSIKEAMEAVLLPELEKFISQLRELAHEWKEVPMLARTHGQPASPTSLGKELYVFVERLETQVSQLKNIPYSAKFGGATGNLNAHKIAFPEKDWIAFANRFVNEILGLSRSQTTTQIEHYDNMAALCDCWKRINTILTDLCRDVWAYVSMDYFKQRIKEGEVGSSAMPHKVNPIDFENAEGNLGIANALFEFLAAKLPVSRLQRDLTDSTVLRNIGVPFAHTMIALKSVQRGAGKLLLNREKLEHDLEQNWAVVAEALQTILRREGFEKPYEALKSLTRKNETITRQSIAAFVDGLSVSDAVKEEMKRVTPQNYTGYNFAAEA